MGITIFASGQLASTNDIQPLIADVKSIATRHDWTSHIVDDDFDAEPDAVLTHDDPEAPGALIKGSLGLKGIVITIGDGAEPFSLLFDRSGVLTDLLQQLAWIESKGTVERFTSCKTQFADIGSHVDLVEVLDLIKKKYLPGLTVDDEGSYWAERDRRLLAEKRIMVNRRIRRTERLITGIELSDEERFEADAIADKIENALRADEEGEAL